MTVCWQLLRLSVHNAVTTECWQLLWLSVHNASIRLSARNCFAGIGPFDRTAELVNGRAAMVGYAILAYVEYNQELRRAATLIYSRLQQQGPPGLGL